MPSTDRRTRRIRPSLAAVAAVCATVLLCGGCAGEADEAGGAGAAAAHRTSLEEIATAIGCTAEVSVEAEELRQGGCETGQGPYRMVTFAAEEGLRSWLTESRMYGGTYLVGDRWVVTAQTADALATVRGRLGGSLETGSTHTEHTGSTEHPTHP